MSDVPAITQEQRKDALDWVNVDSPKNISQRYYSFKVLAYEARVKELEAENERLREALNPFATYAGFLDEGFDGFIGEITVGGIRHAITYNALRRARAAQGEAE